VFVELVTALLAAVFVDRHVLDLQHSTQIPIDISSQHRRVLIRSRAK
jgi:hypothetical protein